MKSDDEATSGDVIEPTALQITKAVHILHIWGGLRDRHLDVDAIVSKMLTAALNAE